MAEGEQPAPQPQSTIADTLVQDIGQSLDTHAQVAQQHLTALTTPPAPEPAKRFFGLWPSNNHKNTPTFLERPPFNTTEAQGRNLQEQNRDLTSPDTPDRQLQADAQRYIVEDEQNSTKLTQAEHLIKETRHQLHTTSVTLEKLAEELQDCVYGLGIREPTTISREISTHSGEITTIRDRLTNEKQRYNTAQQERIRIRGENLQDEPLDLEKGRLQDALWQREQALVAAQAILDILLPDIDPKQFDWDNTDQLIKLFKARKFSSEEQELLAKSQGELVFYRNASNEITAQLAEQMAKRHPEEFEGRSQEIRKLQEQSVEMSKQEVEDIINISPTTLTPEQVVEILENYQNIDSTIRTELYTVLGIDPDTNTLREDRALPLLADYAYVLALQKAAGKALAKELQATISDPLKAPRALAPAYILSFASSTLRTFDGKIHEEYLRLQETKIAEKNRELTTANQNLTNIKAQRDTLLRTREKTLAQVSTRETARERLTRFFADYFAKQRQKHISTRIEATNAVKQSLEPNLGQAQELLAQAQLIQADIDILQRQLNEIFTPPPSTPNSPTRNNQQPTLPNEELPEPVAQETS